MQHARAVSCGFTNLVHCFLVVAVRVENVGVSFNRPVGARELFRQLHAKVSWQPVQPRQQEVQLITQRSQRCHPFGSGRAELILMQIAVIPPAEITQREYNFSARTVMTGQRDPEVKI
jgi:hypothetical protein